MARRSRSQGLGPIGTDQIQADADNKPPGKFGRRKEAIVTLRGGGIAGGQDCCGNRTFQNFSIAGYILSYSERNCFASAESIGGDADWGVPVLFDEAPSSDRAWSGDHIRLGTLSGTLLLQLGDCSRIMTYPDAIPRLCPLAARYFATNIRFH